MWHCQLHTFLAIPSMSGGLDLHWHLKCKLVYVHGAIGKFWFVWKSKMAFAAWYFCKNLRISWPSSGHLGIKLGNKVRKNALDLKMGRDVEKDLSFFPKKGGNFSFSTTAFFGTRERIAFLEKKKNAFINFQNLPWGWDLWLVINLDRRIRGVVFSFNFLVISSLDRFRTTTA